jgi:apolipoprotein N-acyltransferase
VIIGLDFALALLSGALLALSFPRYGHPAFAWIALVPLILALSGWKGRPGSLPGQPALRAFLLGLTSGFVYFAGTLYWTGTVIRTFGGIPTIAAICGVILLALIRAFPAVGRSSVAV